MADPALVALLQAAMRRRLITRERAEALVPALDGCGDDVPALRARLQASAERDAIMLQELLPAAGLPTLGRWRRLARLGEGRTASTWLGLGEGRRIAVLKVFHGARVTVGEESERLAADASALIGFGSRYLVGYLDAGRSSDGRALLVEEYVPGRDLQARASTKGPMAEVKALPLLRQAAKGLHVLDHHGHCHGLLHPGNILVSGDGRARLSDYGLAASATGVRAGWDARTLLLQPWSAPETLVPEGAPTAHSDQYALACIGYWLLSGQTPFAGSPDEQAAQHLQRPRPDVRAVAPRITAATAHALARAMSPLPGERFASALAFAEALHASFLDLLRADAFETEIDATPTVGTAVLRASSSPIETEAIAPADHPPSSAVRPAIRRQRRRRRR